MDAFYEAIDNLRFVATPLTRGPWDPRMQHGGPPSALLARALTAVDPVEGQQLGRVTFEILRPVPLGQVHVEAKVDRPGRKVSMVSAVMTDAEGSELILARAWRIRTAPLDTPAAGALQPPPPPTEPDNAEWFEGAQGGFPEAVEVSFIEGGFREPGPATAWFKLRVPLVAGTDPQPSDVLFVASDCGNGISAAIDFGRFVFINTDLHVSVERMPSGERVCLQAETAITPGGVSIARGRTFDEQGSLASSTQTLFVEAR